MYKSSKKILESIVNKVSSIAEVKSIGVSGTVNPLPAAGEGDIDIFIYCDEIPEFETRRTILSSIDPDICNVKLNIFEDGNWGTGDYVEINGVETWLMYFKTSDTEKNVCQILNGEFPDKIDNYYYPIGRIAMLEKINILYDDNEFLRSLKDKLSTYPETLSKKIIEYHMDKLSDIEDMERAVYRKDVLFYHFALDIALDHFLQVAFAINKTYFPSRKRSLNFIRKFEKKTNNCEETLLEIIRLGGYESGLKDSYKLFLSLINELSELSVD